MVSQAAIPEGISETGIVLTFVVPAPNGCDLSCPFCFVRQRGEAEIQYGLVPSEYMRFIREVDKREAVAAICIQGYEPLLPESFIFTRAILAAGSNLGIPTSLVTNGTHLSSKARDLAMLGLSRISISVDSAYSYSHDRIRGKKGAWKKTIFGIEEAISEFSDEIEISVASVLLPKKRHLLDEMPDLLRSIGVSRWVISVVQHISGKSAAQYVGNQEKIIKDLSILLKKSIDRNIELVIDDEFGRMIGIIFSEFSPSDLRIRRLHDPYGVVRLLPNGQCSTGKGILKRVEPEIPKWIPGQVNAGEFIKSIRYC